jgi:hypothetical protein
MASIRRLYLLSVVLLLSQSGTGQHRVEGVVVNRKGHGIPGVNVIVEHTLNTTVADVNGHFALIVEGGPRIVSLKFFLINYRPGEAALTLEQDCEYKLRVLLLKRRQKPNKREKFVTIEKLSRS